MNRPETWAELTINRDGAPRYRYSTRKEAEKQIDKLIAEAKAAGYDKNPETSRLCDRELYLVQEFALVDGKKTEVSVVEFTQYLRPHGTRQPVELVLFDGTSWQYARNLTDEGYELSIEQLSTGEWSLACDRGDELLAMKICQEREQIPEAAARLLAEAFDRLVWGEENDEREDELLRKIEATTDPEELAGLHHQLDEHYENQD